MLLSQRTHCQHRIPHRRLGHRDELFEKACAIKFITWHTHGNEK